MHTQVKGQKMKRWAGIFVTLLSVLVVLVPLAQAADVQNSGRIVQHTYKSEIEEVGDVPGHILGVTINRGLVFFTKGEIVPTFSANIVDLVGGKGLATGRRVVTYPDGSTTYVEYKGTTTTAEGGKKSFTEGTYECVGGTGRFAGRKGTGTFKAERVGSFKTGGDSYVDFSDNCKTP
jgi:hypothetical protein